MSVRFLAPLLLLVGAVAPAAPEGVPNPGLAAGDPGDDLYLYESRPGDTLRGIADRWLVAPADESALTAMNGFRLSAPIPAGTTIRLRTEWLKAVPLAAEIERFRGRVRVQQQGEAVDAEPGLHLAEGDWIETGADGFVTLLLPDESRVSLPSASRVRIERLRHILLGDSLDRRFRLERGGSEQKVTPMANPASRFLVTTPLAVAAVRGTRYRVRYTPDGVGMMAEVQEGVVAVRLLSGGRELLVHAGEGALVQPGGAEGPFRLLRPPTLSGGPLAAGVDVVIPLAPMAGAERYRVELARDSGFFDRMASVDSRGGAARFPGLAGGTYFVRTSAVDSRGMQGMPAVFSFTRPAAGQAAALPVAPALASAPVLVPAPVATAAAVPPVFAPAGGALQPLSAGAPHAAAPSPVLPPVLALRDAARMDSLAAPARPALAAFAPPAAPMAAYAPFFAGGGFPGGSIPGAPFPPAIGESTDGTDGNSGGDGATGTLPGDSGLPGGGGLIPDPNSGSGAGQVPPGPLPAAVVPEPRIWLLLLAGFGLVGWALRSRRRQLA